jgi:hypothetical protein
MAPRELVKAIRSRPREKVFVVAISGLLDPVGDADNT